MIYAHVFYPEQEKKPLDRLIDGIRKETELPKEETAMVCNRCIKQDVCKHIEATEALEKASQKEGAEYSHIEIDCKHREPATDAQLEKMKNCGYI